MTQRRYETWPLDRLKPYARNAREHPPEQVEELRKSLRQYGWVNPLIVDQDGEIIAGHGRVLAAKAEGLTEAPVYVAVDWPEAKKRAFRIMDNRTAQGARWNEELLRFELAEIAPMNFETGFTMADLGPGALMGNDLFGAPPPAGSSEPEQPKQSLSDRFFAVPFSVLNAREGWWQDRKRAWLILGIQSELGRGENLLQMSDTALEPDPEKRKVMVAKRAARAVAGENGGGTARNFASRDPRFYELKSAKEKELGRRLTTQEFVDQHYTPPTDAPGRREVKQATAGKGWAEGGPARRDVAFYKKKREWEKANGRKISTTEFRQQHWDGYANEPVP